MLLLTLLLLLSASSSAVNAAAYGVDCQSTTCGDITIRYPFYQIFPSSSSIPTSFCGYPGLAVTCNNSTDPIPTPTPILTLPNNSTYIVIHIDYVSNAVTLIDNDVVSETSSQSNCPRVRHNLTVDNYPLTNRNLNLAFYFNCSNVNESIPAIECLTAEFDENGERRRSYVFEAGREPAGVEWGSVCEEKVVAAVVEDSVDLGNLVGGYGEAMKLGFVLDWGMKKGVVECGKCEKSGGMCGYKRAEDAAEEFVCYCKDGGVAALKCKSSKFSLTKALNFRIILSFKSC